MIIAIDGPAASGKGTLARRIARHFGLAYLDTGSLYRRVACLVLAAGADPENETAALAAAHAMADADIEDEQLRGEDVGRAASVVAAMTPVRAAILDFQRDFARAPKGCVLDGRDIGTVVFPDADIKFFVTASPRVRARRRVEQLRDAGVRADEARILEDLLERDRRDRSRAVAPLVRADDAHLLDTTNLDIETAFKAAVDIIERHGAC